MKKIIAILCTLLITLSMSAQKQKKVLVAYFSATGTTESVAKQVASAAKADIYEIKPTSKYTSADLDWHDKQSRSSVEMADKNSRPTMKGNVKNIKKYSTIYIGFPIWWGVCPRIINTFIEANNLKGKTIIPFATSGSSQIAGAVKELRGTYPTLTIKDGKLLNDASTADIKKFVK